MSAKVAIRGAGWRTVWTVLSTLLITPVVRRCLLGFSYPLDRLFAGSSAASAMVASLQPGTPVPWAR